VRALAVRAALAVGILAVGAGTWRGRAVGCGTWLVLTGIGPVRGGVAPERRGVVGLVRRGAR